MEVLRPIEIVMNNHKHPDGAQRLDVAITPKPSKEIRDDGPQILQMNPPWAMKDPAIDRELVDPRMPRILHFTGSRQLLVVKDVT
jgi:hypothetical protein